MIPPDSSLTPDELANRRKAQGMLLMLPLGLACIIIAGATTHFLNDLPAIWRGAIYLGDLFAVAFGVVITGVCLFSREWRMAAINGGCLAAAIVFLVVASSGAFGPQFPQSAGQALHIIGG